MPRRIPSRTLPVDRTPDRPLPPPRPDEHRIDGVQMASIPKPKPAARAKAQLNLAAMALDRPDPEAWLTDLLDALGLRERLCRTGGVA